VTSVSLSRLRTVMMVILLAGVVSACGRRGPLEPPPDPSAPKVEQGKDKKAKGQTASSSDKDDGDDDGEITAPVGQAKKRPRHFVIPKEPFILDPLL
jgi:predicted small lipoprotein YifL